MLQVGHIVGVKTVFLNIRMDRKQLQMSTLSIHGQEKVIISTQLLFPENKPIIF